MDKGFVRTWGWFLIVGFALWGPGLPLATAQQLEITPELVEQCRVEFTALEVVDPELAQECNNILQRCIEARDPNAPPEARQEAEVVAQTATAIHEIVTRTIAQLPVLDAAVLQKKLVTDGAMAAPVAQELAQKAQAVLTDAKTAFASGDPLAADRALQGLQQECHRYGVNPSAFAAVGAEGGLSLSFDRVAFAAFGEADQASFLGKGFDEAAKFSVTIDVLNDLRERIGAPAGVTDFSEAGRQEMLATIDAMELPQEEKLKMRETLYVCETFVKEGDFAGLENRIREMAAEYEAAMREIPAGTSAEQMTPTTEHSHTSMTMDPRTIEYLSTTGTLEGTLGGNPTGSVAAAPTGGTSEGSTQTGGSAYGAESMSIGGGSEQPSSGFFQPSFSSTESLSPSASFSMSYDSAPRSETSGSAEAVFEAHVACNTLSGAELQKHIDDGHCP